MIKKEQLKKLYSAYSTFSTNKCLTKEYKMLTGNSFVEKEEIRHLYNETVNNNFPNETVIKNAFFKSLFI